MTELVKFDLAQAAEQLKGQIRSAFIDMLPPEQFEAAVKAELEAFMRGSGADSFRGVCFAVFREAVSNKLKETLGSPEWSGFQTWDPATNRTRADASDAVKEWLSENATKVVQAVLQEMMGHAVQRVIESARVYR